ncbi:hypothetical protein B0A53_04866 [Rhodotorula sp. CCFEE 5036]|nr:hypothetical protein B0A53_04866 [Rhodotorula sp. CCFEE 5036]
MHTSVKQLGGSVADTVEIRWHFERTCPTFQVFAPTQNADSKWTPAFPSSSQPSGIRSSLIANTSLKPVALGSKANTGDGGPSVASKGADTTRLDKPVARARTIRLAPLPYEYLKAKHDPTSVGILLGLAVSYLGTGDPTVTSVIIPQGVILDAPGPVPLPGNWQLELKNDSDDPDTLRATFQHGSMPVGAFGRSVAVKVSFARVVGAGQLRLLHEEAWSSEVQPALVPHLFCSYGSYACPSSRSKLAAAGRWPTSEQESVQQYCCTITFLRDLQPGVLHTRHADICLQFLRPDDADLELWTTSGLLATASDYYKTLLASGCAETIPSGSKRKRGKAPPPLEHKSSGNGSPAQPTIDWHDSDDETDDFLVERDWSGRKTAKHDSTDLEYQQIDVRETAYSTMNAVLVYLMTGHIDFAPLNSLLETRSHDGTSSRRTFLDRYISIHPTLPPPVSPKSVYRLAHLLQREELQQLALDALTTSLTPKGAAHELFSPVSIAYADVRNTVIDYVIKNWEEVQASESWNEMSEKAMAGEIEGAAQISFALLRELHTKGLIRTTPAKST